MDIHQYDYKFRWEAEKLQKRTGISERNKVLIRDFVNDLLVQNVGRARACRYMGNMAIVARKLGKDLDQANEADLKGFVAEIQQRTDYSPWTKQLYKVTVRKFYKWLLKSDGWPPIVKWININFHRSEKRLPGDGDLLMEVEVRRMIELCDSLRDKALIAVLWDSGARIGEIGKLRLNQV